MTRRSWIKTVGCGTAAAGISASLEADPAQGGIAPYSVDAIGLISGTIQHELAAGWERALEAVAALGYRYYEGGAPEGVDPAVFAAALRRNGLQCLALGSSMDDLLKNTRRYLSEATALGASYLVCYWPWLSSAQALTREETLEAAGRLNQLGATARAAGVRLVWHNHDKEFTPVEGGVVIDLLLRETDPELVGVELDWYWVVKGGEDPVALFQRHPGRFDLAHVKDMNNHDERGITCVGCGVIDFERIIRHAAAGGTRHLIVENERAIDGLRCARVSLQHLKTILG